MGVIMSGLIKKVNLRDQVYEYIRDGILSQEFKRGENINLDDLSRKLGVSNTPIRDFPLKDNKVTGALEIFQQPQKSSDGNVPQGRYIAGVDPYDQDQSETMSLASVHVLDLWTDQLVAEYTGRPMFADDFYDIVWKLCKYYNARCMYEQNLKGIFTFFSIRH